MRVFSKKLEITAICPEPWWDYFIPHAIQPPFDELFGNSDYLRQSLLFVRTYSADTCPLRACRHIKTFHNNLFNLAGQTFLIHLSMSGFEESFNSNVTGVYAFWLFYHKLLLRAYHTAFTVVFNPASFDTFAKSSTLPGGASFIPKQNTSTTFCRCWHIPLNHSTLCKCAFPSRKTWIYWRKYKLSFDL